MTESPANIILAMPTEQMHRMIAKTRIWPMLELRHFHGNDFHAGATDTGATATNIPFPGGALYLVTAKSGAAVKSVNARYLVLDETDSYPDSLPGEGNPVSLLIARTATFGFNRKDPNDFHARRRPRQNQTYGGIINSPTSASILCPARCAAICRRWSGRI